MKIRTDFVTNSSSSSFILARRGELTEEQKNEIIDFVEKRFLGKAILTPDSTEEEIEQCFRTYYFSEEEEDDIREALEAGEAVYWGEVCHAEAEYKFAETHLEIWDRLESVDDENFTIIDGDLSY